MAYAGCRDGGRVVARLLALDLGERRIGVAASDPTGTLTRPLTTIIRSSVRADSEAVARLVREYAAVRIVVGMPLSLNGTEGPQARKARRYAERLAETITVPIQFWDERYSSATATEILKDRGKRRRRGFTVYRLLSNRQF